MRSQIYFPIERAKAGEFSAMQALSERTKSLVCPAFDLPIAKDAKAFDLLQSRVAQDLARNWGTAHELFLDLSRYDPDAVMPDGTAYVSRLFESARQSGLRSIPVVGPIVERHGVTGIYFKGVAEIVACDGRGAAIRLPYDDLKNADKLNAVIDAIQEVIALGDSDCDVILDFGPLDNLPVGRTKIAPLVQQVISDAVSAFTHRHFRVLVACGSSIPRSTGKANGGDPARIPNAEFQAWSASINSPSLRHVRFGDYGARYALQTDKGSGANPPARIHLSTRDTHLLFVGDGPTYRELAEKAKSTPEFASQSGTWGKYAVRDSTYGRSAGNAETWVARDTHMHVETLAHAVVERLEQVGVEVAYSSTNDLAFDQAELFGSR